MHPEDVKLDQVLRRALGRAGVVTGYDHRCRRKGCGYSKEEPGNDPCRCPKCNMRLWAKPLPRGGIELPCEPGAAWHRR